MSAYYLLTPIRYGIGAPKYYSKFSGRLEINICVYSNGYNNTSKASITKEQITGFELINYTFFSYKRAK